MVAAESAERTRTQSAVIDASGAPVDAVLQACRNPRRLGDGRWAAHCPAHEDRRPSLSIRETADGTVLLKCWGGCNTYDIVTRMGLRFDDLFPKRTASPQGRPRPRERRPFTTGEAIRALEQELTCAWVILHDLYIGKDISGRDKLRAGLARERCLALIDALRYAA